jgi:hypothetical protein
MSTFINVDIFFISAIKTPTNYWNFTKKIYIICVNSCNLWAFLWQFLMITSSRPETMKRVLPEDFPKRLKKWLFY